MKGLTHDFEFYFFENSKNLSAYKPQITKLAAGILLFRGGSSNQIRNSKTIANIFNLTRGTNVLPGVELSLSFKEPDYLSDLPFLKCHAVNIYSTPANFLYKLGKGLKGAKNVSVLMHPFHKELQKNKLIPLKTLTAFSTILKDLNVIPVISEKQLRESDATLDFLQFMFVNFELLIIGSGTNNPVKIGQYPKLVRLVKRLNSFWNQDDCLIFLDRKTRLGREEYLNRLFRFENL